jgi:antirestriction protein
MEYTNKLREIVEMDYSVEPEELDNWIDENVRIYEDCNCMADVAYEIVEETGLLDNCPEPLKSYFDYEAYGRDLEIEGTFHYLGLGVYAEIIA